jgi:hypothetical protein
VQTVASTVDSLQPDSSSATVSAVLPASSTDTLLNAVNLATVASGEQLQEINTATTGTTTPPANHAPVLGGSPGGSVMAGNAYSFQPTATDDDGDTLIFSISNQPAWAAFDSASGRLSGTPVDANVGSYGNISIGVSDGTDSASLPAFSIQVTPVPVVNTAPVISGTPVRTVMATASYSFQPTATDADGDALTFSISGKPAWATFTTSTGRLAGVPGTADVGSYSNIVIRVTDGTATASLASFSIDVTALPPPPPPPPPPANTAPQISGNPAGSVTAGSNYLFQPGASDADGDTLTFSISSKPAWASFNTATGVLSGTPFNADAGSYANIVISVSDGVAAASLPAFSIQVTANTGSFTLQWTAPAARSDGSPLSLADIDGYRIYYGTSTGNLAQIIDVTDGTAVSAAISNVSTGTWYVAMTTYDVSGLESSRSGVVTKTAQ